MKFLFSIAILCCLCSCSSTYEYAKDLALISYTDDPIQGDLVGDIEGNSCAIGGVLGGLGNALVGCSMFPSVPLAMHDLRQKNQTTGDYLNNVTMSFTRSYYVFLARLEFDVTAKVFDKK